MPPIQNDAFSSPSARDASEKKVENNLTEGSETDDSDNGPTSYIRDPHKLVCYLIPFPSPANVDGATHPVRFLIYTPPPPPLRKPAEGEKDSIMDKVQRKWQREVRAARTNNEKLWSYKGVKGRFVKGHDWVFNKVTSADLEFVNRIPTDKTAKGAKRGRSSSTPDNESGGDDEMVMDEAEEEEEGTTRTVKLEEMIFVYPPSIRLSEDELRTELINSLTRTKTKAQRDVMISTGLLPLSLCADAVLAHVGGSGGFTQVNGGWAALTIRGAKNARSITKRLASSTETGDLSTSTDNLRLVFRSSSRVDVMRDYLASKFIVRNEKLFEGIEQKDAPGEADVLEAIGWEPSGQTTMEVRNWEDEAWERQQVEDDFKGIMKKAAKTWESWCKLHAKHPKRAAKK